MYTLLLDAHNLLLSSGSRIYLGASGSLAMVAHNAPHMQRKKLQKTGGIGSLPKKGFEYLAWLTLQ